MKRYWDMARTRIDDMSLRERAMIFAAAGFVVISLINSLLLDLLLAKQKILSAQVVQQQEKMKELQATIQKTLPRVQNAVVQAHLDDLVARIDRIFEPRDATPSGGGVSTRPRT